MIRGIPTSNPHVARFVFMIREQCSQRATCDPAAPRLADSLRDQLRRTHELVALSPSDAELIDIEIRRGTGT